MMIGNPADRETGYGEARPPPARPHAQRAGMMGTYSEFMPIVMEMLQSFHREKPITGDDL
jgi:hypothetical protein